MKARRPSSCSLSTSTATPATRAISSTTSLAVGRLADRRRRDGADRLGAELLGEPHLSGHDLGDLGHLVGVDRAVVLRGLADPRVGALLHHLAELALLAARRRARGWCWSRCRSRRRASLDDLARRNGWVGCPADPGTHARRRAARGLLARMRGVLELAEQPGDHEGHLLADVDRVVADALQRSGDQHHHDRPLAAVVLVADLDRQLEALLFRLSTTSSWRTRSRARSTSRSAKARFACLIWSGPSCPSSTRLLQHALVGRRLVAGDRDQLGDVDALVAHPLHALHDVEQGRDQAQVGGDRRLRREQREDRLVDLQVAAIDDVVVGDHQLGQLDVLVPHRLHGPIERPDHEVQPIESAASSARSSSLVLQPDSDRASADLPGHVVLGALIGRVGEDLLGLVVLDEAARSGASR